MSRSASQTPNLVRKQTTKSNQGPAGAVDEDFFYGYFASIETREMSNAKELQDAMSDISRCLKCHSEDWEKRVKALRELQSITSPSSCNEDFLTHLRQLQSPLQSCLSDLRSQVVREACLCVAYLAHVFKLRLEQTADVMMPYLIGLVPNSAKVMATSGMVCLSIIVTNIQSPKVLLHVIAAMSSKSNLSRRFANRLLEMICSMWDTTVLGKQISNIESALLKGMGDADQEVRATCRSAFLGYALKFPQLANKMMMSMDSGRRSLLDKELINHPANELMSQVTASTKRRTSCPPAPTKVGTRGPTPPTTTTSKKNYASDSDNESSQSNTRAGYATTGRSRIKAPPHPSGNVMSRSVNRNVSGISVMVSSTTSLSTRSKLTAPITKAAKPVATVVRDSSGHREGLATTYLYKPSGSSSASMPRRKIPTPTNKGGGSQVSGNGLDPGTYNYHNRRQVDSSDDNDSETSSMESSDLSKSSVRAYKTTDNIQEITRLMASSNWSDKRDGLINLQNVLPIIQLSHSDLKKITDVMNTLFVDTKSKIFHLLLSCVQQLIETHQELLTEWLYTLLMNLINKQANETLASHQKPIQETLSMIRSQFPLDVLVRDCCKIISETYHNSSMKLKVSILAFFKTVIMVCPSHVLDRSLSSLTPTVNILIDWTFDSKWQEIRKISNALLLKFNDLHPRLLDTISQCLPPIARQKINNLVKQPTNGDVGSKLKMSDNYVYSKRPKPPSNSNIPVSVTQEDIDNYIKQNTEDLQALSVGYGRYENPGTTGSYSRLKPYNFRSQLDKAPYQIPDNEAYNPNILLNSNASYMMNRFQSSLNHPDYAPMDFVDHKQGSYQTPLRKLSTESLGYSAYPSNDCGPYNYGQNATSGSAAISDHVGVDMSSGLDYELDSPSQAPMGLQMLRKISELPANEMALMILSELCNLNQRTEQRKACLMKLINLVRDNSISTWNEIFKTALMRLLETLKDNDPEIRSLALRVLQEFTKHMSGLFDNFTHLTVLKVLHTHMDSDKTVVRAAEECSQTLARYLSPNLCVRVLAEVIKDEDCRLNIGCLKMLLEILKTIPESSLLASLGEIMPGLIYTSEHAESHIRKSSIFCLVEIHRRVGDDMWPYLANLSSSKVRLLRLYIDKTKPSHTMTESMFN